MAHPDPNFPLRPQSKFPWPIVAVVVAALLLAVLLFNLPRAPRRGPTPTAAEVPAQPFGQQLQLTNIKVQPSPSGGNVYVQGTVSNASPKKVNDVTVVARFYDKDGNVVHQDTVPMQALPNNTANTVAVSFAEDPLNPDSSKEFRLAFDNVPATWNRETPALEVAHVGFAGQPPASAQGNSNGVQTGPPSGQVPASDVNGTQNTAPNAEGKPAPGHESTGRKHTRSKGRQPAGEPAVPTAPPL